MSSPPNTQSVMLDTQNINPAETILRFALYIVRSRVPTFSLVSAWL
jgi:hypothetical protein